MSIEKKLTSMAVAAALGMSAMAMPLAAKAELSGNIGVFSKYVLRGLTNSPENDDAAIQGGLDWTHPSGFYLGYWGSSLGYNYESGSDTNAAMGFENDFYGGFAGEFGGGFSYDVGLIQYYYIGVDDSDLTELKANIGFGPAYFQMQYLLNDGWWGNQGDIYWTLGYDMALPKDFTLSAVLGWYTYDDDDNSDLCAPSPAGCGTTTENSAFRHLNLTLSHPIGNTGADWAVTYIIGGKDRTGTDQEDTIVLSLTYGFDI